MSSERTERATPKRRREARRKGQVARSADLNGAVVLLAGMVAIAAFGPAIAGHLGEAMQGAVAQAAQPQAVNSRGIGTLMAGAGLAIAAATAPIALPCLIAGLAASVAQVGLRPSPAALKPDPKRLDPVQGAKNLLGRNALVEAAKSSGKIVVVGGLATLALLPKLTDLAALVGIPPTVLGSELARRIGDICWKAALAYLLIGVADAIWQRRRLERNLRMRKDEVRREQKEEALSPELRASLRRRQTQMSRGRMMAAVLGADVVVTNPTHFAVALLYDGSRPAPVVVAKGRDLIALTIRRVARENGVPVVENPPLARSLHDSVKLGGEIPEHLYRAIAELLAFVYRTAGGASRARRAAA